MRNKLGTWDTITSSVLCTLALSGFIYIISEAQKEIWAAEINLEGAGIRTVTEALGEEERA